MSLHGSRLFRFVLIGVAVFVAAWLIGFALRAKPVVVGSPIDPSSSNVPRVGTASAEECGTRVELPNRESIARSDARESEESEDPVEEAIDADEAYADLLGHFAGRRLAFQGAKHAMPPDPVETGGAELFLRLFDGTTNQPTSSIVQLWHLDAPESETWSAGNQQQYRVSVPVEGYRFTDLAYGRYRAFVHVEGRSANSPAAFKVFGLHEKVDLRLTMPQRFSIHLAVHRFDGTRVQRAALRHWDSGISLGRHPRPAWGGRRSRKVSRDDVFVTSVAEGTSSESQSPDLKWSTAESDGFRIGPIRENRRDETRFYFVDVAASPLVGPASFKYEPDMKNRRFVSVAVKPVVVLRSLRLAGGGDATHAGDQVIIQPQVLALGTDSGGDRWRDVPVLVRVRITNYEPLEFRFTPRDVPLAPRRLKPSR